MPNNFWRGQKWFLSVVKYRDHRKDNVNSERSFHATIEMYANNLLSFDAFMQSDLPFEEALTHEDSGNTRGDTRTAEYLPLRTVYQ